MVVAFSAGILVWGGFNTAMEWTNREAFCISCHEMRDSVFREYQHSIHYRNRSGVRATCPDCHVPRDWMHKVVRKILAVNELYHALVGTIATPAKFEARRDLLARQVWRDMRRSDSRECRNCHALGHMDLHRQKAASAAQHRTARDHHRTCIDCHQGIAHALSERALEEKHQRIRKDGVPCATCHQGMANAKDWE